MKDAIYNQIDENSPQYNRIDENSFLYIPRNYAGPIAIDVKPSRELKEYHENSRIQINIDDQVIVRKIKDSL